MLNHFLLNTKIFTFLVFFGTITFSNQVVATSFLTSDSVTTSPSNFSGLVTKVTDGDTLDITNSDGETITIRLALIDAPETKESGYKEARTFLTQQCLDKGAQVDPDNNQGLTYGRTVAVVYCEGVNMNEEILDEDLAELYRDFCDISEFANTNWAGEHGCSNSGTNEKTDNSKGSEEKINQIKNNQIENARGGDDLDCNDFEEKNIPVKSNDPHNLDADGDGIGCEG